MGSFFPDDSTIHVLAGDVALGDKGTKFKILLGSCISVILTNVERTIGCVSHIVHTHTPRLDNEKNTTYGQPALETMFAKLRAHAIDPLKCEAYVFGGGNMFPYSFKETSIGYQNAEWVLEYLYKHNIHLVDTDTGGKGYRKVSWTVGTTAPILIRTIIAS